VLQAESGQFFCESEKGKILYQVTLTDDENSCTCGDFAKNSRKDPNFRCKHILSVMNSVPLGEIENGCFLEKKRPKLDERWIIEIEGSQFVKYAGLLDYAHQIGIGSIEVEPLQLPTKDNGNFAILKATVVSKVGESFTDIGDANPTNCNAKVGKHLLRLASTRAIARALRSFTNVGLTALEELADLNDVLGYDVFCGQFIYQGGTVCWTFCGIELQVAAGWRKCVGDVELISWFWRLPSGGEGNFLGKALAVALGHANDTTVKNRIKRMAGSPISFFTV